jgi:hypothetical protein
LKDGKWEIVGVNGFIDEMSAIIDIDYEGHDKNDENDSDYL